MRQRLDTQPIRRRLVAGTFTAADVRALLDEVMAQRQENTELIERLGRRAATRTQPEVLWPSTVAAEQRKAARAAGDLQ